MMHLPFFTFALAASAVGIEALFGYPDWLFKIIRHPVTWMGSLIATLDRRLNRDTDSALRRRAAGFLALFILLLAASLCTQGLGLAVFALFDSRIVWFCIMAFCASTCLAQRSLARHVGDVAQALESGGLAAGRKAVAHIVGRDVEKLDESGVCRAAIESLAENFSDGIIAPAFWIAILGPLGGFLYKAINTADSMIGHRTKRYADFGFAAAKLDDLVNLAPARLSAAWICLAAGGARKSMTAWRITLRDARGHPSPNAGWPEAAMAGALGIKLGGPRVYAERKVDDAWIGDGRSELASDDIRCALRLYKYACAVNFIALSVIALLVILRS
jgi:adenosylcobinamide-phosphate synthase